MAKQKKRFPWLAVGMLVYAVVFLTATWFGLKWFWSFIESYELSRPKTAIDAYMAQLTPEDLHAGADALIAGIDQNLQTPQQCYDLIDAAVSQGITYARNAGESSDSKNVYMLLSGERTIGKVTLVPGEEDQYGFTPWVLSGDSFDFSFLLGSGSSITVPHDHSVSVNGVVLNSSYIIQDGIRYGALEEFYESYDGLPYMVTYETPAILGEQVLTVTDAQGNAVTIDDTTDLEALLNNCTDAQLQQIETFANAFVDQYVTFISCSNTTRELNYERLVKYIVRGSDLQTRMDDAIWGLRWAAAQNATVTAVTVNRCIDLGDGRYVCDLTYHVHTKRYSGNIDTQTNIKLMLVSTDQGLLAQTMIGY